MLDALHGAIRRQANRRHIRTEYGCLHQTLAHSGVIPTTSDNPTLVLIHGTWHGSWCWEHVLPHLERAGIDHVAVELPLSGHDDDVAAARRVSDAVPGSKVAVGHSYGGHVLAGAAVGRGDVVHLVYVAAFILATGNRVIDELTDLPGPLPPLFDAMYKTDDGRAAIRLEKAGPVFYNTSPPDWADAAIARLRPMDRVHLAAQYRTVVRLRCAERPLAEHLVGTDARAVTVGGRVTSGRSTPLT